jgi:hypothetical protein
LWFEQRSLHVGPNSAITYFRRKRLLQTAQPRVIVNSRLPELD